MQLFNTPTQKTQEDIDNLGNGMDDLWRLTNKIETTYSNSTGESSKTHEPSESLFEDNASLL